MTTTVPTRLSVNISQDTLVALQEIAADHGVTATEALRRLVGYGVVVYRADKAGHEVLIRRKVCGQLERVVLLD